MITENFTYETDEHILSIKIPNMYPGDLGDEWFVFNKNPSESFNDCQIDSMQRFVDEHFAELATDETNVLNTLKGFTVDKIDWTWDDNYADNFTLTVDLYISVLGTDEDGDGYLIEDRDDIVESIIESIKIDDEPHYDPQQEQYEWWMENGCSSEDELLIAKFITQGQAIIVDYGDFKDLAEATQDEVDAFVDDYATGYVTGDEAYFNEVKEAVEQAGFKFNLEPTFTKEAA